MDWVYKKIFHRNSFFYRSWIYGIIGVFVLFFLFTTQTDASFNLNHQKSNFIEANYNYPGSSILEFNYRSDQLSFLEGFKNKRSVFTFVSPFDIAHRLLNMQLCKLTGNLEHFHRSLQPDYCLSFLLLDLPPPDHSV